MVEQALQKPVEASHLGRGRKLHGPLLWFARGAYITLFLIVVVFFFAGFKNYVDSWNKGGIGASVQANSAGELVFSVGQASDAAKAGIVNGDILQEIDGIPVTTAEAANQLLVGAMGDPLTLTVLSYHQFPRQVELTFASSFLQLLSNMHLSTRFLVIYNTAFSILLTLGVILSSPLVFFRRSKDWLVILVAFSMIGFASFLITPVGYGAARWHVYFLFILIYLFGLAGMITVFFVFPSGHFEPRWTRWVTILLVVPVGLDFWNLWFYGNSLLDFYFWIGFFAIGAYAQIYRYRRVSTGVERQQTKRVVLGAVACFSIIAVLDLASIVFSSYMSYSAYLLFSLFVKAGATLPVLILDISFVLAIYRYRLWDTDVYINRTLVYTVVTLFLISVWLATTQVLNYASLQLFDKQPGWLAALLSSLQIAVIYKPVRNWTEKWVNKRFYKDRIDYEKALIELHPSMWSYMTPLDLVHTLVTKVPFLLQSTSSALFIQERSGLILTEVHDLHPSEANKFHFTETVLKKLEKGEAVTLAEGEPFKLLVPLTIPRLQVFDLIGVLAMGPRTKNRGYSRDHLTDLTALGRSAGTALHMLQLNERKQSKGVIAPLRQPDL
jgi:hypothetical protein